MGLMNEYIEKGFSAKQLQEELTSLIKKYNARRDTYLLIYCSAIAKGGQIPDVQLGQQDYYAIHDLISGKGIGKKLDVFIETPGGSGEAAEEIARLFHKKYEDVTFVISGEAKSAGTILVLSGDHILMTETASLGPIDAQVKIGRGVSSAHDYWEWVKDKKKEAEEKGQLNSFDAIMVAQITPGEIDGVFHSLKFAEDLVKEWLVVRKFKNWATTRGRNIPVTPEMKKERAAKIAEELTNHSKWRSHGRSLKIEDLVDVIKLEIERVEADPILTDIVYRIHAVYRLIFEMSTTYKIFATQDNALFKQGAVNAPPRLDQQAPDVVQIEHKCPQCGKVHRLYGKLSDNPQIDNDMKNKGFQPLPKLAKIRCDCGFEADLSGIINDVEMQTRRKIVF